MKLSSKILLNIISGEYQIGQTLFVGEREFHELLTHRALVNKEETKKAGIYSITINGITIMKSPEKMIAAVDKRASD